MAYEPTPQSTEWQMSNEIDASKTALLVVDILGGSEGTLPALDGMVASAVRLIDAAHEASIPVIFACDAHLPGIDREIALWGEHGMVGTEGSRPLDALGACDTDIVIHKRRYDAFFETDLDITLRELGVDTLIVIGCDTNICVHHTLAGAYYRMYKTVVPFDATATFLIGDQATGLDYFARCFDTRVVSTETALGYLVR